VLLDMAGVGFAHARYLSPHLAKKTVEVVQESFPMRFKAFHVLHEPFYFDAILTVLKPFLKDKIRRRVSYALNWRQLWFRLIGWFVFTRFTFTATICSRFINTFL
jgi:CRAL/TRIO domain